MDHGVICTRCRAPVSSRDRKPQFFATCPACSHPAPLKRMIAEGVAVFVCADCVPVPGLLSQVLGRSTVTVWGEVEDQGKPVTLAPEALQRLKDPASSAHVDEVLLAERDKLWRGRALTYTADFVRCVQETCKRYLKRVRAHSGTCVDCKAPLVDVLMLRTCPVEDCPKFGERQVREEDPFCEHCKGRLKIAPGRRMSSQESHAANAWAQQVAQQSRVPVVKAGQYDVEEGDDDAPTPRPVPVAIPAAPEAASEDGGDDE